MILTDVWNYRPFQTGARFSANAKTPSLASSLSRTSLRLFWANFTRSSNHISEPLMEASFMAASDNGALAGIFCAISSDLVMTWSGSTT